MLLRRGQPPCDDLSRKEEGVETYKIDCSRNPEAFPEPNWPSQSLSDLIGTTFDSLLVATAATDHGAAGIEEIAAKTGMKSRPCCVDFIPA
jgi:hypothetical protein